jgi:hypothetical protein
MTDKLPTPANLRGILSALGVAGLYCFTLWRIIKRNAGNKVIECGSIALMVFFVLGALIRADVQNLPSWVIPSLGLLLFLLCLLTMVFLFSQGFNALRNRKSKPQTFHHSNHPQ